MITRTSITCNLSWINQWLWNKNSWFLDRTPLVLFVARTVTLASWCPKPACIKLVSTVLKGRLLSLFKIVWTKEIKFKSTLCFARLKTTGVRISCPLRFCCLCSIYLSKSISLRLKELKIFTRILFAASARATCSLLTNKSGWLIAWFVEGSTALSVWWEMMKEGKARDLLWLSASASGALSVILPTL